jgi:hypothetical protein
MDEMESSAALVEMPEHKSFLRRSTQFESAVLIEINSWQVLMLEPYDRIAKKKNRQCLVTYFLRVCLSFFLLLLFRRARTAFWSILTFDFGLENSVDHSPPPAGGFSPCAEGATPPSWVASGSALPAGPPFLLGVTGDVAVAVVASLP